MADAVGCVTKAIDLALKIKDAVDTVRQNRKDCAHIKRRAERVRRTLSLCEGNAELMESPAVRDAVEALAEVLGEALELVAGCQAETNAVCLYCTARKLSKQLSKVDRGISDGNVEATLAILVYHISKQTGDAAGPAMRTEGLAEDDLGELLDVVVCPAFVIDETPDQITEINGVVSPEQTPDEFFVTVSKKALSRLKFWVSSATACLIVIFYHQFRGRMAAGCYSLESSLHFQHCASEYDHGDNGALLQEIARVTLAIMTGMETIRRNKEECAEIAKLASRASVILLQLEDKETMKDMAVVGTLKRLLVTFRHAHELVVVACQRRSVVVLCSPGKLSSELRGVLDEMMLGLDDLIDVLE